MALPNKRSPVAQFVKMETSLYPIVVFGTLMCGECAKTWTILRAISATEEVPTPFKFVDMNEMGRQGKILENYLSTVANGKSAPFVFSSGSYVGGHAELDTMARDGSLKKAVDRMRRLLFEV